MIGVTSVVAQVRICAFYFWIIWFYGILDIVLLSLNACMTITLYGLKITAVVFWFSSTDSTNGNSHATARPQADDHCWTRVWNASAFHAWLLCTALVRNTKRFIRNVTKYIVSQMLSLSTIRTICGMSLAKHSCYEYLHFMHMSSIVCLLGVSALHVC